MKLQPHEKWLAWSIPAAWLLTGAVYWYLLHIGRIRL